MTSALSLIAGALGLLNGGNNFTTNSITATSTNKDEILGSSTTYLAVNLDSMTVHDNFGNQINLITNSGTYILVSQDGRGYQTQVSPPTSGTHLNSYLPGSLGFGLVTNLQATTNGTSVSQFSAINWMTPSFTVNPNFFLAKAYEKNGTQIFNGLTNGLGGQIGASLISPIHIIQAAHAAYMTGRQILFQGDNGVKYFRTVVNYTNLPSTDIGVALLDSELPTNYVHPFSVLPVNYTNKITMQHPSVQLVLMDQSLDWHPVLSTSFSATTNAVSPLEVVINSSALWVGTGFNRTPTGGDSGHPICMLNGTNFILISSLFSASGGNNYALYEAQINGMMHYLSHYCIAGH